MAESEGISLDNLRVLAERVHMHLSTAELEHLKPMFDFYVKSGYIDRDPLVDELRRMSGPFTWSELTVRFASGVEAHPRRRN